MELYAGLDLHSRNTYIGIMDKAFKLLAKIDALLESAIKDDYSTIYWIFRKKTFFKCRMA